MHDADGISLRSRVKNSTLLRSRVDFLIKYFCFFHCLLDRGTTNGMQGHNIFKLRGFPYLCFSRSAFRLLKHILGENGVTGRRIVNQNMSYRAYQFFVLQNRTAAHECVKYGTTIFLNF